MRIENTQSMKIDEQIRHAQILVMDSFSAFVPTKIAKNITLMLA